MNPIKSAEKLIDMAWKNNMFPVDPVTVAKRLGVNVLETVLPEDVSGALIKEAGKDPIIVVHRGDSNNRKRFSCAHELGHYIFRVGSKGKENAYEYIDYRSSESSNGDNKEEIFANNFAANLLMPERHIRQMALNRSSQIEMAAHFGVSNEALKYRLLNLNLFHEELFA